MPVNLKLLTDILGRPINLGFRDTLYRLGSSMILIIGTINQQNNVQQSLPLIILTNLRSPNLRLSLTSQHEQDKNLLNQVSAALPPLKNPAQKGLKNYQQLERKHENILLSIIVSMEKNSC